MSGSTSRGSEPANTHIWAPWARYSSLSQKSSASAPVTEGPRSGPPAPASAPDRHDGDEREQERDRESTRSEDERHGALDGADRGHLGTREQRHPGDHAAAVDHADVADPVTGRERARERLRR